MRGIFGRWAEWFQKCKFRVFASCAVMLHNYTWLFIALRLCRSQLLHESVLALLDCVFHEFDEGHTPIIKCNEPTPMTIGITEICESVKMLNHPFHHISTVLLVLSHGGTTMCYKWQRTWKSVYNLHCNSPWRTQTKARQLNVLALWTWPHRHYTTKTTVTIVTCIF